MKKSLKTIVRAISPFTSSATRRNSDASSSAASGEDSSQPSYSHYHWNLEACDLKQVLKLFYRRFNPEKAYIVSEILIKYEGDEELLLQQLCERYNLSQEDMQHYLDQAPKPSGGGSGSGGHSRLNGPSPRRQSAATAMGSTPTPATAPNTTTTTQQQLQALRQNQPPPSSATTSGGGKDYQQYSWDLKDIDVGAALSAIYKKYNPTKVPNLSAIQNKTHQELVLVLRQLCKRHDLNEQEMRMFLDQARIQSSVLDQLDSDVYHSPKPVVVQEKREAGGGGGGGSSRARGSVLESVFQSSTPFPGQQGSDGSSDYKTNMDLLPTSDSRRPSESSVMMQQRSNLSSYGANENRSPLTSNDPMKESGQSEGDLKKRIAPQYYMSDGKRFTMSPLVDEFKTNTQAVRAKEEAVAAEIENLKAELEHAQQRIKDLNVENDELATSLHESKRRRESMHAQQIALFKAQKKNESLQLTIERLREEAKEATVHYDALMDLFQAKVSETETLSKKFSSLQSTVRRLQSDKADLLQLINILSSAPMPAKNVLEAYFSKLAATTPRDTFLQDEVVKAKDDMMGERVDRLLQWKRKTEAAKSPGKDEKPYLDEYENGESEDERNLPDDEETPHLPKKRDGNDKSGADEQKEKNKEDIDASLKRLSPNERRIYESLQLQKSPLPTQQSSSRTSSRSPSPVPNVENTGSERGGFLGRGRELPSVTSSEIDDGDAQDLLNEQYELAKKYYHHQKSQQKISEKLARANLNMQEQQTDRAIREALSRKTTPSRIRDPSQDLTESEEDLANDVTGKLDRLLGSSNQGTIESSARDESLPEDSGNEAGSDWVECFDSRTRRKYYYNTKLKKSTWTLPPGLQQSSSKGNRQWNETQSSEDDGYSAANMRSLNLSSLDTNESMANSRSKSPATGRRLVNENIREQDRSNGSSNRLRAPSPSGPLRNWNSTESSVTGTSRSSQPSSANSTNRFPSNGSATTRAPSAGSTSSGRRAPPQQASQNSPWVTAVDPKSQRRYWYNRETKVSTWRKPVDLI
eukprot:gene8083-8916_t